MKRIVLTFLASILILHACSSDEKIDGVKKNIHFNTLRKISLKKDSMMDVKVIMIYPNEEICSQRIVNANLYICEDIGKGDTLYVFDSCKKILSYVKENLDEGYLILDEDVINKHPDSVAVVVPKLFSIRRNSKYIFANLTRYID